MGGEKRIEDLSVEEIVEQIKLTIKDGRKYTIRELINYLFEKSNNFTSLLINDSLLQNILLRFFNKDIKSLIKKIESIDNPDLKANLLLQIFKGKRFKTLKKLIPLLNMELTNDLSSFPRAAEKIRRRKSPSMSGKTA